MRFSFTVQVTSFPTTSSRGRSRGRQGDPLCGRPAAGLDRRGPPRRAGLVGSGGNVAPVPPEEITLPAELLSTRSLQFFANEAVQSVWPPSHCEIMVEIDRGTMPIARSDIRQTSLERKMRAYLSAHATKQHERQFGWKAFRVLIVTTNDYRISSTMDQLRQITGRSGLGRWLIGGTAVFFVAVILTAIFNSNPASTPGPQQVPPAARQSNPLPTPRPPVPPAQPVLSPAEILQGAGLFGLWAPECGQPVSASNSYLRFAPAQNGEAAATSYQHTGQSTFMVRKAERLAQDRIAMNFRQSFLPSGFYILRGVLDRPGQIATLVSEDGQRSDRRKQRRQHAQWLKHEMAIAMQFSVCTGATTFTPARAYRSHRSARHNWDPDADRTLTQERRGEIPQD